MNTHSRLRPTSRTVCRVAVIGALLGGLTGALTGCGGVPIAADPTVDGPSAAGDSQMLVESYVRPGVGVGEISSSPDPVEFDPTNYFRSMKPERPNELIMVTNGSSSCPNVAERFVKKGSTITGVLLKKPVDDRPCTADFGPSISVLTVPSGYTVGSSLTIDGTPAPFRD